ncbi:competence protein ComF [Actinomyces sp. B33]|uniref:ComF family protein n=1 Tax=Actinomyces sp. B33 TaxID=2942131 RepID=UPI0023400F9A|nr:competence protein ComF [Actinomyces sp. B33]MDC4232676.1 competence protein ComF [Actinomyces sp. B33]
MSGGALTALADALWPVQCAGCGAWDQRLCPQCIGACGRAVGAGDVDGVPLVALGPYDGALRGIVLAVKHAERFDPGPVLDRAGGALGAAVADGLRESGAADGAPEVWVVPAPSSWARRLLGRPVVPRLARAVGRALADAAGGPRSFGPARVRVVDALVLRPGARSQSGRGSADRRGGREGAMAALVVPPAGVPVVLVDDVVTTGATAREMIRLMPAAVSMAAMARA